MRFVGLIVAVALVLSSTASCAEAVLQTSGPGVIANHGKGFAQAAAGVNLAIGTRVMVMTSPDKKESAAVLTFADACSITLSPGQVFTVGERSPCAFRAEGDNREDRDGGFLGFGGPGLLIGGVFLAGGLAAGILAATSNRDGNSNPPLPVLSH